MSGLDTDTENSADHLSGLKRFGFFLSQKFLSDQTTADLLISIESIQPDIDASRIRRGVPFARRNLLELDFVQALIDTPLVQTLIQAIAPASVPVRAILFDKTGPANWTVPWHQDRSIAVREKIDAPGFGPWSVKAGVVHVQPPAEILQQMFTLRFNLDACPSDNGPLRVIAKTHERIFNADELDQLVADNEQTLCTTDAGGLVAVRPLLLHASSPATKPSHRRVIHIEFGPPNLPAGLTWAASPMSAS